MLAARTPGGVSLWSLLLLLGACGGDDEGTGGSGTSSGTTGATSSAARDASKRNSVRSAAFAGALAGLALSVRASTFFVVAAVSELVFLLAITPSSLARHAGRMER